MLKFKIKLFLSYSIDDQTLAKKLKNKLQYYPLLDVFMAPDDIGYGILWDEEIKYRIKNCDAVIALITKNFHSAKWTEQEMGLAWAFEKKIIGLTTDNTLAKGYVERFQINPIREEMYDNIMDDLVFKIYPEIEDKADFVEHLINHLLPKSSSYYESNCIGRMLRLFVKNLTLDQSTKIIEPFFRNGQVTNAGVWRTLCKDAITKPNSFLTLDEESKTKLRNYFANEQS